MPPGETCRHFHTTEKRAFKAPVVWLGNRPRGSPQELRGNLVLPGQLQAESCTAEQKVSDVSGGSGKQSGERRNAIFQQNEQICYLVLVKTDGAAGKPVHYLKGGGVFNRSLCVCVAGGRGGRIK